VDPDLIADLEFPPFRLDLARGKLMQGDREIELRRRTWEVLLLLVQRAGKIVGKRELMERVWGDVVVSDQTLSTSIYELRKVLGDDRRSPTFIETVHGRGFRFLIEPALPSETPDAVDSSLVGREASLLALGEALQRASAGERQLVFVRGEAGIGKTSLVRAFLAALPPLQVHEEGRRTRLIHASA
jgi:DNA-binding winged helix-turn-helix (wHTH) protein